MHKIQKNKLNNGRILSFIPTGDYYFHKGVKAFQRYDLANAKKYLQRAAQLSPKEPMIHCQLAIILSELGLFHESNKILKQILLEMDKEMVECHYFMANNLAHLGDYQEAYQKVLLYLTEDPEGEFETEATDLLDIIEFEKMIHHEEADPVSQKQKLAQMHLERGKLPQAISLLEGLLEEKPDHWIAYSQLSLAYFYHGDIMRAYDANEKVQERNPGNLYAVCNELVFSHNLNLSQKVDSIRESLFKVTPMHQEEQLKLAATFAVIGDYKEAANWFGKLAASGYQGDVSFYYWWSLSLHKLGKTERAIKVWSKVSDIYPEHVHEGPWEKEFSIFLLDKIIF